MSNEPFYRSIAGDPTRFTSTVSTRGPSAHASAGNGIALAESRISDERGLVARSLQSLVVAPRA